MCIRDRVFGRENLAAWQLSSDDIILRSSSWKSLYFDMDFDKYSSNGDRPLSAISVRITKEISGDPPLAGSPLCAIVLAPYRQRPSLQCYHLHTHKICVRTLFTPARRVYCRTTRYLVNQITVVKQKKTRTS